MFKIRHVIAQHLTFGRWLWPLVPPQFFLHYPFLTKCGLFFTLSWTLWIFNKTRLSHKKSHLQVFIRCGVLKGFLWQLFFTGSLFFCNTGVRQSWRMKKIVKVIGEFDKIREKTISSNPRRSQWNEFIQHIKSVRWSTFVWQSGSPSLIFYWSL